EGAVAKAAETPLAAALQHRTNRDRLRLGVFTELLDETAQAAQVDLGVLLDDDSPAGLPVLDRLHDAHRSNTPRDALVRSVVEDQRRLDVLLRPAVVLTNDDVLRDVD